MTQAIIHTRLNIKRVHHGLIALLLLMLASCGGDSSSSTTDRDINSTLNGKIILGNDGWQLDIDSGEYSRIPGVESWDDNPNYLGIARVAATPVAYTGSELIETVHDCQLGDYNCMNIYTANGDFVSGLLYTGSLKTPIKPSRDGLYLAVSHQYGGSASDLYLEIHSRDGNLVDATLLAGNFSKVSFDWTPDNRLVYTLDDSIYITTPVSTQGNNLISFTTQQGKPEDITVSPDGTRLAFSLVTDANAAAVHGYIYTLNIDGSGLNRLAVVPGNDDPILEHPGWSPDGQWILVQEGDVNGQSTTNPGLPGTLFAVPATGTDVPLTSDTGATSAILIESRFGTIVGGSNAIGASFVSDGNLHWVQ